MHDCRPDHSSNVCGSVIVWSGPSTTVESPPVSDRCTSTCVHFSGSIHARAAQGPRPTGQPARAHWRAAPRSRGQHGTYSVNSYTSHSHRFRSPLYRFVVCDCVCLRLRWAARAVANFLRSRTALWRWSNRWRPWCRVESRFDASAAALAPWAMRPCSRARWSDDTFQLRSPPIDGAPTARRRDGQHRPAARGDCSRGALASVATGPAAPTPCQARTPPCLEALGARAPRYIAQSNFRPLAGSRRCGRATSSALLHGPSGRLPCLSA